MKFTLIIFVVFSQFCFSQEEDEYEIPRCKLEYQLNTKNLDSSKSFELIVFNRENRPLKIADTFLEMRIQAKNISVFKQDSNEFMPIRGNNVDVCFLDYKEKFVTLKPNESKTFNFNVRDLSLPSNVLSVGHKYRLQFWFDMIDLLKGSRNEKCIPRDFTSDPIVFDY